MNDMKHRRLQELDSSDFEIVKGEPDIRGWDVKNGAGLKIGEVEELIVDAQQKKVRYIVVDLDDDELKIPERKVLIPIGLAELHHEDDDVLLPSVTVDQLSVLPAYEQDNLNDEVEQRICTALGRTEQATQTIAQVDNPTTRPEKSTTRVENRGTEQAHTTTQAESSPAQPVSTTPQTSKTTPSKTAETTPPASIQQPAIGTAEYYGNFYQHAYFSDYNLYKNRQQERRPSEASEPKTESDYERGLRLWELRNEADATTGDASAGERRNREMSNEQRKELREARRKQYEEQRIRKKGNSIIIQRINEEGLQDG